MIEYGLVDPEAIKLAVQRHDALELELVAFTADLEFRRLQIMPGIDPVTLELAGNEAADTRRQAAQAPGRAMVAEHEIRDVHQRTLLAWQRILETEHAQLMARDGEGTQAIKVLELAHEMCLKEIANI